MPVRVTSTRKTAPPVQPQDASALPFGLPQPPPAYVQKPPGISLCMIVKNEEHFLGRCLASVADVVDEKIVVDTGSTDRTIEIARSFGATVLERAWRNDFAWARNQGLEVATKRWILVLDADEELTSDSKAALLQLKSVPAYQGAVWVRCFNESDDYRGTGAMSHVLIRLFPNHPEIRYKGLIHEFPTVCDSPNGLEGHLAPVSIVHHGYLKDVVAARNKAERNLAIVREAAEREPEDPFHWFNLGSTAFMIGDFELAREALERMRALSAGQRRGFLPNGLALLAEVYCDKLHDAKTGEEISRECLRASPHYANAHFQLGKSLVALGRTAEAREAYEAAIADEAHAHLQFVVDDQVYVWKSHSEIGSTYVNEGDETRATEWFRKGLARAPKVEPLQVNLARSLDRQERYAEAEAAFREAYEDHHTDLTTIDYVNFLLRRGEGMRALEIIEAAHQDTGDETAAALLSAAWQIVTKLGLASGERFLEAAAERAPHSAEVLNPLEAFYRRTGNLSALEQLLERERRTEPRTAADYLRRSFQSLAARDFAGALALAERGLELAPAMSQLRYNAALASAHENRKGEALAHLAQIAPEHGDAFAPGQLLRAALERELGRAEDALASLDRLLEIDAHNADGLLLRAGILETLGRSVESEQALRRVYDVDRRRGGIELAAFYLRAQRFDDAARIAGDALAS
jgi:tetratricopeptide (TPR) repeat protein